MKKPISANKKSGRGRPKKAGGVDPVSAVRLPSDLTEQVDVWGERRKLNRSEAIRRLVELGLKVKTPARLASGPGQRLRAQVLAVKAIEGIIEPSAPPEERAERRRRLTKGPSEFREDRVDLPKAKGSPK
jgi:Ribbon-helix-helix protein, copG family